MLISADTNYAILQQVEAPQPLRRAESGELRYQGQTFGLKPVSYQASLSSSFDHTTGTAYSLPSQRDMVSQLRQQASSSFNGVSVQALNRSSFLTVPMALLTGFLTAVAAFTMVLRRPYWG
jgi:hypothetical protein